MNPLPQNELYKVIDVNKEKCVNCHACISACPVKFCNDGSGDYVTVNSNMCIACGNCIKVCTHEARNYIDDFKDFIKSIESGDKIIAIVAPSIAANFPNQYMNFNGWLKSKGIKAVFDVSFGAELTIKSYLNFLQKENPKAIIAQPCPAIVSYIQIYKPELLKYLAPVDSPILHTIKMVKNYYKKYTDHKIAIISPCNAKKREFEETQLGDFNVGIKSLEKHFKENNINLNDFPCEDFDNPPAERAVLFSSPGGLLQTIERTNPELRHKTRKIEGVEHIYSYLNKLSQNIDEEKAPVLIDCLSCTNGCNAGPLTLNIEKSIDEIEYWVNLRNAEMQKHYLEKSNGSKEKVISILENTIEEYWNPEIYKREYKNLWANLVLEYPRKEQINEIFIRMHKHTDREIYNCTACGYGSCEQMAVAIFNNLNRPENCHFYLSKESEISHKEVEAGKHELDTILETALDGFIQVNCEEIILKANPAIKKILKRSDLVGRKISDFIDKNYLPIYKHQLSIRAENRESSYELVFLQSDGKQVHCLISATPVLNDVGTRKGSFAMISNITNLKEAERKLIQANEELEIKVKNRTARLSETIEELRATTELIEEKNKELEKLSIVASETDNAILIMDKKASIEWVNRGFEKLYGFGFHELKTLSKDSLFKLHCNQNIEEYVKLCINQKQSVSYETEIQNAADTLWVQTTITPIFDENNHISRLVAIQSNITKLKEAEKFIKQQQQETLMQAEALADSQQRLLDIIDFIPNPVYVIDADKEVIAWNKAMYKLTGMQESDVFGTNNYSAPFFGTQQTMLIDYAFNKNEQVSHPFINYKKEGKILSAELPIEINDTKKHLLCMATILYEASGDITGAIEVIHDITKAKEAEQKIKQANELLIYQKASILEKNEELQQQQEEILAQTEHLENINKELQKLSLIASQTDNAISILDTDGSFDWVNQGFVKLYGYTLEHLKKQGLNSKSNWLKFETFETAFKNCIKNKVSEVFNMVKYNFTGDEIWTQTTLSPFTNENDDILKVIAIDSDITKLKEAEFKIIEKQKQIVAQSKAIQKSQNRLTEIINFLPDAIIVIDRTQKVIAWNKAMENLTGIPALEMLGKGDYEYAVPFYGKKRPILIDLIFDTSEKWKNEYYLYNNFGGVIHAETIAPELKNGSRYISGTVTGFFDSNGKLDGAIEIIRDITEEKLAQEKLKFINEQLTLQNEEIVQKKKEIEIKSVELSEMVEKLKATNEVIEEYNIELEKLSIATSETDNAIIIMDAETNFEWVNEGFTRLYGYTLMEVIENQAQSLLQLHQNNGEIQNLIKQCIAEKKSIIYEIQTKKSDGIFVWAQTTLTPILGDDGEVIRLVSIDSDISKLKEAENEIRKQKEEIEAQRDLIQQQRDIARQQRDQISLQKQGIMDSISYARKIQTALLPPAEFIQNIVDDYFILNMPRDIVSGDFYWMVRHNNKVVVALADCTGHGVPGAFMSMLGVSLLNDSVNRQRLLKPSDILDDIRANIIKSLHQTGKFKEAHDGMDLAICVFDLEKRTIQYSGANNPIFVVRKTQQECILGEQCEHLCRDFRGGIDEQYLLTQIKPDKMPIGIYSKRDMNSFKNHTFDIQKGDTFYLFSDGYSDQISEKTGFKFLIRNFRNLLLENQHLSLKEQKEILENTILDWKGDCQQIDDILIIGLRL